MSDDKASLKYPLSVITVDGAGLAVPGDVAFFYEHAGWGYSPEHETSDLGRLRGAFILADAERRARRDNWEVTWEIDENAEITPGESYFVSGAQHWQAALHDEEGNMLANLGSIDLGFEAEGSTDPKIPQFDDYARVVEAELASEAESQAVRPQTEKAVRTAIARQVSKREK